MQPLTVNYLLDDTVLFGGVKVVFRQADLVGRRGHRARVVTTGEAPGWYDLEAELVRVTAFDPQQVPPADVTVATHWTTIEPAIALDPGEVVHYCQGFEGIYTHNRDQHPAIEAAYRHLLPAMVVTPHLGALLAERFGRPARTVTQPLEPFFRPRPWWRRSRRPSAAPRILVMSPFEADWKGARTALEAVRLLRDRGLVCELVRLSQWPMCDDERALISADEFHCHLEPTEVAALIRSCDLLMAPSWEQEGFGLPALEAMACGVPAVVSDIPAYRDWAASGARLVDYDRPEAFADAAGEILGSPAIWRDQRRRGLEVAAAYSEEAAAASAEDALEWVANGDWRRDVSRLAPRP